MLEILSHPQEWGYEINDDKGEFLCNWISNCNMAFIHNAKDKGSFHSARWFKNYNPDLCIVTLDPTNGVYKFRKTVMGNLPLSQYRPALINWGLQIPIVRSTPKPHWNISKTNWANYARDLDSVVKWIPSTLENYKRFIGAVLTDAKRNIPRGVRKDYIPGWSNVYEELLTKYEAHSNEEDADLLFNVLNENRKKIGGLKLKALTLPVPAEKHGIW